MEKSTLKILSYNIHKGFNSTGRKFVLDEIKTRLQNESPDILVIQEAVGEHTGKKIIIDDYPSNNQVDFLAEGHFEHYIYGPNKHHKHGHHGNAIFSKFPINEWTNHNISTNRFESRGLLHGEIDIPYLDHPLHIFCTHLNLLEKGRRIQAQKISEIIRQYCMEHHPTILAGDFNDWKKTILSYLTQELSLEEAFSSLYGGAPKSFPSFLPGLSLDRIFYKNMELIDAIHHKESEWKWLSDHLPLSAHFNL